MAEQFFQSCKAGDLEAVEAALQDGLDVNIQGEYGSTGLMEALLERQSKVAIYLLKQDNIDVNIVGDIGQTALQYAAWDDATSDCLAILLARSDLTVVNHGDTLGQTALWWAVHNEALKCAHLLLNDDRTDPNISGDQRYSQAIHYDRDETFELPLNDNLVDVNIVVSDQTNSSDLDDAQPHLTHVNQSIYLGQTPLMMAVDKGAKKFVKLLLNHKQTDPNITDKGGNSPLILAAKRNHLDCVELLIKDKRTDINIVSDCGRTALHVAATHKEDNKCLAMLLSQADLTIVNERSRDGDIDINDKDGCGGNSPLMVAVKRNCVESVRLLLNDPRVDLRTRDNYKRSEHEVLR